MEKKNYDVIIIGGSFSGLSSAMALGRALRKILVLDAGKPANRFSPHSHNFITHDGRSPAEIAILARRQVQQYPSVDIVEGFAIKAKVLGREFLVTLDSGLEYLSRKVILATGIIDQIPDLSGFSACWGKSILHCPYCHGYEVRNAKTGILGNGDYAFEFGALISNWTKDLTIYTNGPATLTGEQHSKLASHKISIVEDRINDFAHHNGMIHQINFTGGKTERINVLYSRPTFIQHSDIYSQLGCALNEEGHLKIDPSQRTTIAGAFACGDNVSKMRSVSIAIAQGTMAGMMVNKELIMEDFN